MKAQLSSGRILPEQTILSIWREQLVQAASDLSQTLVAQQPELLPRFAACYVKLAGLPRRVRRRLARRFCRAGFNPPITAECAALRPNEFGPTSGYRAGHQPRGLQRQRALGTIALLLALGQAPALAATINVGGGCKLVDAITAANTDNATGRCRAGRGADTIVLPANSAHTLTQVNNEFVGPTGLPVVASKITIAGNGSTIRRSSAAGTPQFRILIVGAGGNLTLRRTTITGGVLFDQHRGGGAYRRSGRLTLDGCTISGNQAYLGGGVANAAAGTLTVRNSTISGNRATDSGGGIFNNGRVVNTEDGALRVINSVISGNSAPAGGGVRNSGTTILTNSTISGNKALGNTPFARGGGVTNSGSLTLTSSTISGNTARDDGGGVWNYQGTVSLTNSTVSSNVARTGSGGLHNTFGPMTLTNSTVTGNACEISGCRGGGVFSGGRVGNLRSDVVLFRTIISGNGAFSGNEIFQVEGGVVTANNYNLFGHSGLTSARALNGFILSGGSDITATSDGTRPTALASILNLALVDNGGPTQTHALATGSPAIEGAGSCPTKDQRGVPRPQDGDNDGVPICDIGAFERAL